MHVNCTQGRRVGKIKFTRNRKMDGQGLGVLSQNLLSRKSSNCLDNFEIKDAKLFN